MRPFPIANLWITCGLFCVFPVDWVHLLLCSKSFCFGGENSETALFECLKDVNAVQSSLSRRSEASLIKANTLTIAGNFVASVR